MDAKGIRLLSGQSGQLPLGIAPRALENNSVESGLTAIGEIVKGPLFAGGRHWRTAGIDPGGMRSMTLKERAKIFSSGLHALVLYDVRLPSAALHVGGCGLLDGEPPASQQAREVQTGASGKGAAARISSPPWTGSGNG